MQKYCVRDSHGEKVKTNVSKFVIESRLKLYFLYKKNTFKPSCKIFEILDKTENTGVFISLSLDTKFLILN